MQYIRYTEYRLLEMNHTQLTGSHYHGIYTESLHHTFHGAVDIFSADPEILSYRTPGHVTLLPEAH
jgi:hypothetical protein